MANTSGLRVVFAGTPLFAATLLDALCETHRVIAAYTQPDRPAGRGRHTQESAVKKVALARGLPVYQPEHWRDRAAIKQMSALDPDILVVAAYGLLLPPALLALPRLGCINVHASLLPKLRGASPIPYALLLGEKTTGITIMQMEKTLDAGDILHQDYCSIDPADTTESLSYRLAQQGIHCLQATLSDLEHGCSTPIPQDHEQATYAPKLNKSMAQLDWEQPAAMLERAVRAFYPWPIAYTLLNQHRLRILEATALDTHQLACTLLPARKRCGMVISLDKTGIDIITGDGVLRLLSVQPEGGAVMSATDYLHGKGKDVRVGMICETPSYALSRQ